MPIDFVGLAVGTAFGELYALVKEVVQTTAAFREQLKKIESTLDSIVPIMKDIDEFNRRMDRKDMAKIQALINGGKDLVEKCSTIKSIHLVKKYTHSKKLTEFEAMLEREFQLSLPLLTMKNTAEIVVELKEFREEFRDHHSHQANDRALQITLGASGNLAVPEAPDFVVGSEVEASLRELKARLLEEGVSVIVVTAPGGCGKTTLLAQLCHDAEIEGKFKNNIMFIRVSKKLNMTDIVRKMIQHKNFLVPEIETEDSAVQCLQGLLEKIGQVPVLLVLDDVWTETKSILDKFVFKKIKDYKIVVTSRYEFPDVSYVHRLKPLNKGEALELFRRSVTIDRSIDEPDDDLLEQIVSRCKGFPLALTVIAKSLRGKDRSFWETKLLDWAERGSVLGSDSDILDCLRKSLDDLDGDTSIKERLMDLSSFPEDRKIPATALIDLWVELYKQDFDGVRAINDLHKLVHRNLANLVVPRKDSTEDEDKCYSNYYAMQHDLLRELALMECNQEEEEKRQRLILDLTGDNFPDWWSEQKQPTFSARLVSISTDATFSTPWPSLQLPEAEALVLNLETNIHARTYALPEFIEKADKLKALIVTNYSFFPAELRNFHVLGSNLRRIRLERIAVPFLSMGKLSLHNLRKISLFMCDISQASTSNDLKISDAMPKLVELDIDYCNDLVTLPDGICDIKPLKKLSITNCHNFSKLPEQIGQLASLEVIRLSSCTSLSQLPDSIGNLQKLISLNISYCLKLSALPNQIVQLGNLKRMNMRGCQSLSGLPRSIVKLRNLRKVVCDKEQEAMWWPLKSSLNSLNIMASEEEATLDWLRD